MPDNPRDALATAWLAYRDAPTPGVDGFSETERDAIMDLYCACRDILVSSDPEPNRHYEASAGGVIVVQGVCIEAALREAAKAVGELPRKATVNHVLAREDGCDAPRAVALVIYEDY